MQGTGDFGFAAAVFVGEDGAVVVDEEGECVAGATGCDVVPTGVVPGRSARFLTALARDDVLLLVVVEALVVAAGVEVD